MFQSDPKAQWLPVWEQHFACVLHTWWELGCWLPAQPWQRSPLWIWWPCQLQAGCSWHRDALEASAHRYTSPFACTNPVCGRHHRQRGCHHPKHHQADSEQVSACCMLGDCVHHHHHVFEYMFMFIHKLSEPQFNTTNNIEIYTYAIFSNASLLLQLADKCNVQYSSLRQLMCSIMH